MLESIAPNLWSTDASLKILGADLGHRMTVVRRANGELWVHSPIRWSEELAAELAALGPLRDLVVPSRYHDTWMPRWFKKYPAARVCVAPGVAEDHPDWPSSMQLAGPALAEWAPDLEQGPVRGMPSFNEYVFRHVPSRTLIVSDLVFHFPPGTRTGWTRAVLWLNRTYGGLRSSALLRLAIKDRRAFQRSIEEIRRWDFDRIIPGHGTVLDTGGKAAFDLAFPPPGPGERVRKRRR